jgi:uncharacterized protein (TIGR00255 family)
MIRSMTAFARREDRGDWGELIWEIRSVNHRFLEVAVRLPEELRALEPTVRERVQQGLGRGKVDCGLRYRAGAAAVSELRVNDRLADQVIHAAAELRERLPEAPGIGLMDLLRWPGVIESAEQDLTPVQAAASALLEATLAELVEAREREGARLAELVAQRCTAMRAQVAAARERMPVVVEGLRERLRARLLEISEELDPQRIEQEMAIMAQKLDIDEEMDRLTTHLDEVERVLGQGEPVGRRLDFLMQELNREANTLGSKSIDSQTTAASVEMKVLIEQMREQIQNIE